MILLCFCKTIPTSYTMFNDDKFISCSIIFHFKDLKINYRTPSAFRRPWQLSNGINNGYVRRQVFMPDGSLPPRRQKVNFVGESIKKI